MGVIAIVVFSVEIPYITVVILPCISIRGYVRQSVHLFVSESSESFDMKKKRYLLPADKRTIWMGSPFLHPMYNFPSAVIFAGKFEQQYTEFYRWSTRRTGVLRTCEPQRPVTKAFAMAVTCDGVRCRLSMSNRPCGLCAPSTVVEPINFSDQGHNSF